MALSFSHSKSSSFLGLLAVLVSSVSGLTVSGSLVYAQEAQTEIKTTTLSGAAIANKVLPVSVSGSDVVVSAQAITRRPAKPRAPQERVQQKDKSYSYDNFLARHGLKTNVSLPASSPAPAFKPLNLAQNNVAPRGAPPKDVPIPSKPKAQLKRIAQSNDTQYKQANAQSVVDARRVILRQRSKNGELNTQLITVPKPGAKPHIAEESAAPHSTQAAHATPAFDPFGESPIQPPDKSAAPELAAQSAPAAQEKEPVDFQADSLLHDDKTGTVIASGNVVLKQGLRTLKADEIRYDLINDVALAKSNVVFFDSNGDIHAAEEFELRDQMKQGFVKNLVTQLSDGSRLISESGLRESPQRTILDKASFTPCRVCGEGERPAWQIKASEVDYNIEKKRISYTNASFEFYGVPVAYLPYFSHSDGSEKQKSGLLPPSFIFDSDLGAGIENSYYYAIAPDKDLTVGLTAFTDELPLLSGEYRQRWQNADLNLTGGITYSQRDDSVGGVNITRDEEVRGFVFGDALWNVTDEWRVGANVAYASDDQFLRQYDISNEDVLESSLFAERFAGRDYFTGRLITFQDVRVRDEQEDQPLVLPEIVYSTKTDPGELGSLGGTLSFDSSYLGLRRGGSDQDVDRLVWEGKWDRRFISNLGLLTDVTLSARGDSFLLSDRDEADIAPGRSTDSFEFRFFPQAHIQSSFPVARNLENSQVTFEPIVALTLAPSSEDNSNIPNEDSQDVQLDASNLFERNRFPGLDQVEDESRVTYGAKAGIYGHDGSFFNAFVGQSYRFGDDDDIPFGDGSGLSRSESDIVGQIGASYRDSFNLNYRFQVTGDDFQSERQEVDAVLSLNRLTLSTTYLFAEALEGTDIDESREQIQNDFGYYLTPQWRVRGGAINDLGEQPGLRRAYAGFDYFGDCLSWSLVGVRNLTDSDAGDSDTEIVFTVGLKNLGEFVESGFKGKSDKDDEPKACGIFDG